MGRVATWRRLRIAAAMPFAVLVVHQLRYMLAYGSSATRLLLEQGHSYLHSVMPWIVALLAIAAGTVVGEVTSRLRRRGVASTSPKLLGSAFGYALTLFAIYAGQESIEGFLETGHPGGIVGVVGGGGWWAIPVSLAVGVLLAILQWASVWLVAAVAQWLTRAWYLCAQYYVRCIAVCAWRPSRQRWSPRSPRGPPAPC